MEKLESIIFGLKAEVERLQDEKRHLSEEYDRLGECFAKLKKRTSEQKAEIERLKKHIRAKEIADEHVRKMRGTDLRTIAEIQKKVDELENIGCHFNCPLIDFPDFECEKLIKERAVKDTAKEIQQMLHDLGGCDATDDWSKGWDKAIDTAYEAIEKCYGVEVE